MCDEKSDHPIFSLASFAAACAWFYAKYLYITHPGQCERFDMVSYFASIKYGRVFLRRKRPLVVRSRRYNPTRDVRYVRGESQDERKRCTYVPRGKLMLLPLWYAISSSPTQIVKARFGTGAHLLFTFYAFLCILVVCGSLLRKL